MTIVQATKKGDRSGKSSRPINPNSTPTKNRLELNLMSQILPATADHDIRERTESLKREKAAEEYQAALCRFGAYSTLDDIAKVARKHRWDQVNFLTDVVHELYDGDFEPWNAQPVASEGHD